MSSSRKKKQVASVSPTSAEPQAVADPAIALFYTGGPIYGDAPARDLTTADLARLVRIAGLRASGGDPVKPATPAQLADMAASLEASGGFSRQAIEPLEHEEPEAPADPAEEPA